MQATAVSAVIQQSGAPNASFWNLKDGAARLVYRVQITCNYAFDGLLHNMQMRDYTVEVW